jgi:ribosome-binding protein aMBF1 (putative translation factor)
MTGSTKRSSSARSRYGSNTSATWRKSGREKMKTKPWSDIRARKFSPQKQRAIDRAVAAELLEMDLRELREAAGKTQEELAAALKKAQSEISRIEGRSDYRLSTLQRYVAALGGELEVVASFGNRRVRLRAA